MKYFAIHERGEWSEIRQADTLEEAKQHLLDMLQKAEVQFGDVFRISQGEITAG